jgi:hypothetical protein
VHVETHEGLHGSTKVMQARRKTVASICAAATRSSWFAQCRTKGHSRLCSRQVDDARCMPLRSAQHKHHRRDAEVAIEEQNTSNTLAVYAVRPMLVTLFTRLVFPTRCMGLTHVLLCLPCSWHAW